MRKANHLLLALLLMVAGAMNVSAADRVQLSADMWRTYSGFGADAVETGSFEAAFDFDMASSCPIGDTSCNNFADLGNYTKLYVNMEGCDADGNPNGSNPRIFINRMVQEGQFNANKADAQCLVIPNAGTWAEDYYTVADDGEIVINLAKIKKDYGFVHFHSIKGSAYNTQVIVHSLEAEMLSPAQQVGWTNLINNGDMEGDDVSSFFTKIAQGNPEPSVIEDGAGYDGSRGIVVATTDKVANDYDNQFWFRFNEPLMAGAKYRVSFDYRADEVATVATQAHAEPSDYIHYELFGNIAFSTGWQTFTKEGEVTAQQSTDEKKFLSVAFNLNPDDHTGANTYYFDNIRFEVFKVGVFAEYSGDVILLNFGFDTNLPAMVSETGSKRIIFDNSCVTVKVDGQPVAVYSVEGCDDGRFYIFTEEEIEDGATVEVSFSNSLNITYTAGDNAGNPVSDFTGIAAYNEDVQNEDLYQEPYPYAYVTPTLMKSDPEEGSFNLSSNTPINMVFDKPVDCSKIEVTANGSALTVSPSSGYAKEITATGSLPNGECEIIITKVYGEEIMADEIFGEFKFKISVGQSSFDPADQIAELIAPEYFANCASGAIPEGFFVKFGEEERPGGTTYTSGARMFDFGTGGDFTKGLYLREGYAEYGSTEGYELNLEAGKKYVISFNSAMWKDNGSTLDLKVFSADDTENALLTQTVQNKPNVNGAGGSVVTGSTKTSIDFIPEADGKYIVRWDRPGFNEVLIANVKVTYMPNVAGLEFITLLNNALASAKTALEANADERYAGDAYSALAAAVQQYESEMQSYTNPSQFKDAAAAVEAAIKALQDHRSNCDAYDAAIKKAIDVVRQNEMPDGDPSKATKFTKLELFAQLKTLVEKYHGTSEWRNMNEDPEGDPQWQLFYEYDVLTDDAQIAAAVAELVDIANLTSKLFTQGESKNQDTGIKVLVERLRRGAEALKALPGVSETDADVMAALNALEDDDALAERVQQRIKARIYNDLNSAAPSVFQPVVNEETLETTVDPVDMTVYVKNPNIYAIYYPNGCNNDNVPGWNIEGATGLWIEWSGTNHIQGVSEDCAFTIYHNEGNVETNEITGLPVGIYRATIYAARWDNVEPSGETFAYYKTANTPEGEYDGREDLAYWAQYDMGDNHPVVFEDIAVGEDEVLKLGVHFASDNGQYFFSKVALEMTAPMPGYVYPVLPETLKGDVNADGAVDVADISNVITIMAAGTNEPAGDVNGDGAVDVADISNIITIMADAARRLAGLPVVDEE